MSMTPDQLAQLRATGAKMFPFLERCELQILELERGHCRLLLPLTPNINHIGTVYAGALFTLAEVPGGPVYLSSFDISQFYPIVKDMQIRFRRPATTDVTVSVTISDEEIKRIQDTASTEGKCDYEWDVEIIDAHGEVVALTHNIYQLRKNSQ